MKHTKEPWEIQDKEELVLDTKGEIIAVCPEWSGKKVRENYPANARRIVQCVNNFDELLEACKVILFCHDAGANLSQFGLEIVRKAMKARRSEYNSALSDTADLLEKRQATVGEVNEVLKTVPCNECYRSAIDDKRIAQALQKEFIILKRKNRKEVKI